MDIRLTEDYRLTNDSHNPFVIQKRNVVQDKESENYGKETWHSISWHRDLDQVASKMIDLAITQSKVTEISTLHKLLESIKEEIIEKLEEVIDNE